MKSTGLSFGKIMKDLGFNIACCGILLVLFTVLSTTNAHATFVTFTRQNDFLAFINDPKSNLGYQETIDFDNYPVNWLFPSGTGPSFIFNYNLDGRVMKVTDIYQTTSGGNYLGLDDPENYDQFLDGDKFTLSFSMPIHALGMYFITSDSLVAGEIKLVTLLALLGRWM